MRSSTVLFFSTLSLLSAFCEGQATCSCTEYRNGAQSWNTNLCMGPAEAWGRPCYPTPCNPDWTPCTTIVPTPAPTFDTTGTDCANWYSDPGFHRVPELTMFNLCAASWCPEGAPASVERTYAEAVQECADAGMRLPTLAELQGGATVGTGCGGDSRNVWTSDSCGAGMHSTFTYNPNEVTQCSADDGSSPGTEIIRCVGGATPPPTEASPTPVVQDPTPAPTPPTASPTVAPPTWGQCSCAEYRNGATSSSTDLCMGPTEAFGNPCYPTPCDPDWTQCSNNGNLTPAPTNPPTPPTAAPTPPTAAPTPPTAAPTPPTAAPTPPTAAPTPPTAAPTPPTAAPTPPTAAPTNLPTNEPTNLPTPAPSDEGAGGTAAPTPPTNAPTPPTNAPTPPTNAPTPPTLAPTIFPTNPPSVRQCECPSGYWNGASASDANLCMVMDRAGYSCVPPPCTGFAVACTNTPAPTPAPTDDAKDTDAPTAAPPTTPPTNPPGWCPNVLDFNGEQDVNTFVFGDYHGVNDIQGRLFVCGDFSAEDGFSVGDQLERPAECANSCTEGRSCPAAHFLVVQGSITYMQGRVHNGDMVASYPSSMTLGAPLEAGFHEQYDNCILYDFQRLDCNQAECYFKGLSVALANQQSNCALNKDAAWVTRLSGSGSVVCNVQCEDLSKLEIDYSGITALVLNVEGKTCDINSGSMGYSLIPSSITLLNFYEATNLIIRGFQISGSILAPHADMTTYGGFIQGQTISKTFSGSLQQNQQPFAACLDWLSFSPACVPSTGDVDECSTIPNLCEEHQVCRNTPGSYVCDCRPGYYDVATQACLKNPVTVGTFCVVPAGLENVFPAPGIELEPGNYMVQVCPASEVVFSYCQLDGTFSLMPGPCAVRECTLPSSIDNGQILDSSSSVYLRVSCDPGYYLNGPAQLECTGSSWNGDIPTCEMNEPTAGTNVCGAPMSVLSFGDYYNPGGSVDGALYVGGHLEVWQDFQVGAMIQDDNDYSLVVAGSTIYNLGSIINGVVATSGAVDDVLDFNLLPGATHVVDPATFDFGSSQTMFNALSGALDSMTATGTTAINATEGALYFTGQGSVTTEVFHISCDDVYERHRVFENIQSGARIIINVKGGGSCGFFKKLFFGATGPSQMLWNFPCADTVILSQTGVMGSVLAPYAETQVSKGSIAGTLISGSVRRTEDISDGDAEAYRHYDAPFVTCFEDLAAEVPAGVRTCT